MSDQKRSKCYKNTETEFKKVVAESYSIAQVLTKLGLSQFGAGYKSFKQRVEDLKLDTSHFTGQGHLKGKTHEFQPPKSLEEVMVENSSYNRVALKERLLKVGTLENKCVLCGQLPEWQGKPLVLRLDHINGVNNDHRLENLRIVCGHCDSQQITYCGRNKAKSTKIVKERTVLYRGDEEIKPKLCEECKIPLAERDRRTCRECYNSNRAKYQTPYERKRKVPLPTKEKLAALLWEKSTIAIAADFGVSDSCVAKWAKNYGLEKPARGYWRKKETNNL